MARVKIIGIYLVKSPSGRVYVGQSIDIHKRFVGYRNLHGCKRQFRLHASLMKHGADSHEYSIIEQCSINILNERERCWQEHYDACGKMGLNCVLTKTTDKTPFVSEDTRRKMSESAKVKIFTESHLANMLKARKRMTGTKGRTRTEAEKQRSREISLSLKLFKGENNPMYGSARFGDKNPFYGKKHSEETKERVRKARTGTKSSPETLIKLSARNSMGGNTSAKLVLDMSTGIYYDCGKEAWMSTGKKYVYSTFKSKLNGSNKYPLQFKYV